ncbi:MAG: GNAT family N-acetyltransferase [Xanthobacteraceae bacterium]|nr:GNAT family N-acetyltransferase [Xanthobacteraceae bacterium]
MLPDLETERLTLRELAPGDAPAIEAAWQNSPTQWLYQAVEPVEFTNVQERISNYLRYRGDGERRRIYDYVARLKDDGSLIGGVSLGCSHPAIASIGLRVVRSHGGRGYGTELARRMLAFGFGDLRLNRIEADVAIENKPCIRVIEKIGMHREGVARECIFAQGRWWTEARYAMLASDRIAAA